MTLTTKMKGEGFYDAHSQMQASVLEQLIPLLRDAVARIPQVPVDKPLGILDCGCAEGGNSILAVEEAIDVYRKRIEDAVFHVVFNDLPFNNFNRLFSNMADRGWLHKEDYQQSVFAFASGRSFYRQIVAAQSMHVTMSSSSLHWMSRVSPGVAPDHIMHYGGSKGGAQSLSKLAADDWLQFLKMRALELVPGGCLVLSMGASAENGTNCAGEQFSCEIMLTLLNDVLQESVTKGLVDKQRYQDFVMPIYLRSKDEILAPLKDLPFEVNHIEIVETPCPIYNKYVKDKRADVYANELVNVIRGFTESVLLEDLFGVSERRHSERTSSESFVTLTRIFDTIRERVKNDPDKYRFSPITGLIVLTRK